MHRKKIFISYSYDSKEHEDWVENLAKVISAYDIEVIFDKWDVKLGEDLNNFMERSIAQSDRVLIICTDHYIKKANLLKDGVGYEKQLISSQLIHNQAMYKFIPIVRNVKSKSKLPNFLGNRLYVDLSNTY